MDRESDSKCWKCYRTLQPHCLSYSCKSKKWNMMAINSISKLRVNSRLIFTIASSADSRTGWRCLDFFVSCSIKFVQMKWHVFKIDFYFAHYQTNVLQIILYIFEKFIFSHRIHVCMWQRPPKLEISLVKMTQLSGRLDDWHWQVIKLWLMSASNSQHESFDIWNVQLFVYLHFPRPISVLWNGSTFYLRIIPSLQVKLMFRWF